MKKTERERFFEKVLIAPSGCWEWQATLTPGPDGGYGLFYAYDPIKNEKRTLSAHRWSYIHHHGPIPEGLIVMHTCDNRCCVNPYHLRLGTLKDNARDMIQKNRWGGVSGENHFATKLTCDEVEEIRRSYAAGEAFQYELAVEYDVSQSTIGRIIRGGVWTHTPGITGPGKPHRGERHHAAKLSMKDVNEIRIRYAAGGVTQRQLAEEYGVTAKHVGEITRGNKRKDE